MAGLEDDENLDEEIFQDIALLTFPEDVQSVIDDVIIFLLYLQGMTTKLISLNNGLIVWNIV